jgi:excisionase family DNA binding protein
MVAREAPERAMAGKFLTIEEAAAALGVSVDEINRLVDRKKLFPMRDGTALKFKTDEITRAKQSLDDDSSVTDEMALDLDSPSLGGGMAAGSVAFGSHPAASGGGAASGSEDVVIGEAVDDAEWVLGGTSGVHGGSQTLVRGNADAAAPAEGSGMVVGGGSLLGGSDLEIDSLIASASSASMGGAAAARPAGSAPGGSVLGGGDMTLDLSLGSGVGGSAIGGSNPSLAGAGMSGPLDSGVSLEDGDLAASGVDLAAASGVMASAIGGGSLIASGMDLGGDAFDLGDTGEEESASVVIATEDTGDSSFFAAAADDSASVSYDESSGAALMPVGGDAAAYDYPLEYAPDMTFSIWQILGLVCCVLLLLGGALVMFDLLWTIRAPRSTALSAPLLNALTEAFGWR